MNTPLEPVSHEVNLHESSLIPEDFLPDVHSRLIMYKRIANAETETDLDDLRSEVIDRFGPLPDPLRRLFRVTALKLLLAPLGILRLDLGAGGGRVEFSPDTEVDPLAVVKLVQSLPATYRLDGATLLRITRQLPDFDARVTFAQELIKRLTPTRTAAALAADGIDRRVPGDARARA